GFSGCSSPVAFSPSGSVTETVSGWSFGGLAAGGFGRLFFFGALFFHGLSSLRSSNGPARPARHPGSCRPGAVSFLAQFADLLVSPSLFLEGVGISCLPFPNGLPADSQSGVSVLFVLRSGRSCTVHSDEFHP